MGIDRRLTFTLAALAALHAASCRRRRPTVDEHAPPPPPAATSARAEEEPPPVDRALPDELAEGTARAFGFPLPRVMNVKGRFDDVVFASGSAAPDMVANYVRRRVIADKILTGPEKTIFTRASLKTNPGALMTISVVSNGNVTELEVREIKPKPAKEGLSPEDRWRELGFRPDGTPLDPTQLH